MKTILTVLLLCWSLSTGQASNTLSFTQSVAANPVPFHGGIRKPIKIATIYPDQQASDYWRRNLISMTARLEALNIRYTWKHFSSQPSQTRLQEQQLTEALQFNPDVLVISIDSPRIRKILGRVLYRATTQVIIPNQTIANDQWRTHPPLLYTGFDHEEGSQMLARYLFDKYGPDARYAIICGTQGQVSELRTRGFQQVAVERHAPPPLAEYYTDQAPDRTYQAAMDLLSNHEDVDFIFCTTTDIALDTSRALKALNRDGKVCINGWGGGKSELEALQQGDLEVTVMRMNDDSGVSIAEAIKYMIEGREKQIPPVFSGEIKLLAAPNLGQIDALIKQAFRYSEPQ